ncbi:tyrosine protein phosphatase, partial [Rhizobiaceae bacterium]|nr:tyrosine protein phosphatase [Rhizobiaceae bacterium]
PEQVVANRATFAFHDIPEPRDDLQAVSEQQVAELLDVLRAWAASSDPAIVLQCWMGVSRSTAAAALALAVATDRTETDIAQSLRAAAPFATPNPRIIAIGDAILKHEGALSLAIESIGRGVMTGRGRPFSMTVDP